LIGGSMANHFHAVLDHIQQLTVVNGYEAPAPAPPPPTVSDFTLIDADRDEPIPAFDPVPDGATVNLATLPTRNLNLRANRAWRPVPGRLSVTAVPYAEDYAGGAAGAAAVGFTVIDEP
jgi:hypothetical protein